METDSEGTTGVGSPANTDASFPGSAAPNGVPAALPTREEFEQQRSHLQTMALSPAERGVQRPSDKRGASLKVYRDTADTHHLNGGLDAGR